MMRRLLTVLVGFMCCLAAPGTPPHAMAEQQSTLSVQARPLSSITVQAADGSSIVALPFAAAMRFSPRSGRQPDPGAAERGLAGVRASVLVLYGVPTTVTQRQLIDLSARLATFCTAPLILLAPTGAASASGHERALIAGASRIRWLAFGRRAAIPSGVVDVHVLPREPHTHARTLAVVHVKVPYMDVGVAYQVAQEAVKTHPPEEDVLIVDLDQLRVDDLSSHTLSMLDPGMAIIIDGAQRLRKQAELTEFADRLYEMWIDVYTVDSSAPLVVTADARGVILPLHGRHA